MLRREQAWAPRRRALLLRLAALLVRWSTGLRETHQAISKQWLLGGLRLSGRCAGQQARAGKVAPAGLVLD